MPGHQENKESVKIETIVGHHESCYKNLVNNKNYKNIGTAGIFRGEIFVFFTSIGGDFIHS